MEEIFVSTAANLLSAECIVCQYYFERVKYYNLNFTFLKLG